MLLPFASGAKAFTRDVIQPSPGKPSSTRTCPVSTLSPALTRINPTLPARGAAIGVFIFIASITTRAPRQLKTSCSQGARP